MNGEYVTVWKEETVVAYLKKLSCNSLGKTEENHGKL
jgi:hypothetical protein